MSIIKARLQNYRSYGDSTFAFSPHVNIIVGPNASGKTNLLDAIHFMATGTSMRLKSDNTIQHDKGWARVDGVLGGEHHRSLKLWREGQVTSKELVIDERNYRRLPRDQIIPVVLFEPDHLFFITSSPDMRRQLVDSVLEKSQPGFPALKNKYTKTLRQRNALLKRPIADIKSQVFAWDIRLSELAGQYVQYRQELITRINELATAIYSDIANNTHTLKLTYESKINTSHYANALHTRLEQRLDLDIARGFTGYGPHRDDIEILIDNKDMRDVASRGETRSILLTLKIIEAQILEEFFNQKPIFLLDDVFGELDGARRKSLIEFISGRQAFITTTDADIVIGDFNKDTNTITLER